ncbi:FHA domain-containing protein [Candidatus Thiosymbion oneisti]|uniref:FHA domain-containing protein n=1 Tax=Candidatus Thiosymbion oneisti TaxID=589554 RepID=UPI000A9B9F06|nr:ATP-binding cassette domain-containing protein [Candidatus Thiosymbion oneisti]
MEHIVEFKTSRQSLGRLVLVPNQDYGVGSDESNAMRISGSDVQPQHARFRYRDGLILVEPIRSARILLNGETITDVCAVSDGDWVAFGSTLFQVRFPESDRNSMAGPRPAPAVGTKEGNDKIIVGRIPSCGLPIDSPLISRKHAQLQIDSDDVWLEDLKSTNGTWVNGQRINERVVLHAGDRVSFASFVFVFSGSALEPVEAGNRVRVAAYGLNKTVTDRTTGEPRNLLADIDLVINPGEFVVIFGTSGSGKSTLLDALNGRRPASSGEVSYNGVDLYRAFDLFRSGIGYVPQQDIVHRKITVRNALRYTARLRLPPDTSAQEIEVYIERVLERVGLMEKGDLAVDTPEPLSGGQLKRVSLAVELVANPNILFLDEATSGLDAGTDKRMMRLFAGLAGDGKTVACVTHSLENIDHCHLVALLHQGRLVYYGPPGDAAEHFGVARLSDVYEALDVQEAAYWSERFVQSPHHERYVRSRLPTEVDKAQNQNSAATDAQTPNKIRRSLFDIKQAITLTRRYADLLFSDHLNLLVLLLQAPLIALVVGAVFDTGDELPQRAAAESQITFVLILSAIWFGCINSAREIVKELPIYLRERAVVVAIPAYLVSKLIPLALLCLLQCVSFLAIVTWMLDFSGPFDERLLTLFLAGFAATGMGLAVSAFVNSNDKAIAALPLLLIPQFILSNSVVALTGATESFARVSVIAYWGLDAMRATLDSELLMLRDSTGKLLIPVTGEWAGDLGYLAAQAAGFLVITLIGLKLKDRKV